jgi:formylglycine-generating enzyme required for sulfatase activity
MKYSTDGGQTWHHGSMAASGVNPAGFSTPQNFEIFVPQDLKGFFLRRSDISSGAINPKGIKFVWNYAQDGLSDDTAKAANTLTKVFGIEMVYIPEGAFFAGDGASASTFRFKQGSADDKPWYVSSENAITTANIPSNGFYYQSTGAPAENASGDAFLIPNSFPKGYKSFYMMKYELTEGEWVGFFNTLPQAAKINHDITSAVNGGKNSQGVIDRNTVSWDALNPSSKAVTMRPSRPISYVSWPDVAAFADWAGLRPMTELEFEKAARGVDVNPATDEFAWGTSTYNAASSEAIFPSNQDETGSEAIFDGTANLNRNDLGWTSGDGRSGGPAEGQRGPLRTGIFAENTTSRVTSGAGYYGNMELSGNLAEPVVTVGRSEGRQFLGSNGDGELSTLSGFEGYATNVDWPGIDLDARKGVNKTLGIGYRGGDFQSASIRDFQISSRSFAAKDADSMGFKQRHDASSGIYYGGRLVRTSQ